MGLTQVAQRGQGCSLLSSEGKWRQKRVKVSTASNVLHPWLWVQKLDLGWQCRGPQTGVSCALLSYCVCIRWVLWVLLGFGVRGNATAHCRAERVCIQQYITWNSPNCFDLRTFLPSGTPHCTLWKLYSLARWADQMAPNRVCMLLCRPWCSPWTLFFLAGKSEHRALAGALSFGGNQLPMALAF